MKMKVFFVILILATLALATRRSYDGYQVWSTQQLDASKAQLLRDFQLQGLVDFWKDPNVGYSADIMVSPDFMPFLNKFLEEIDVHYTIMIHDVEELSRQNRMEGEMARSGAGYDWRDYYGHDDINRFLAESASSNDGVEIVNIGRSVEGRAMDVIVFNNAGTDAPIAWIEAGIHAREWIASATATFMINELLKPENKDITDKLNIHILPMANPDGYEYSRNNDRHWRKNRGINPGSTCKGVDLNRNWGFHWGESGVSSDPCSEVFCGSKAFSEIESQNIKNYVERLKPTPVLGHCIHSYSQLWLWPYGYDYNAYPENKQEIKKLAEDASDALFQVHGTYFDPINSADLYPAAGASDDWYRGSLGTTYSFTTELRDKGYYGFELPASQIIPSGEELFAGMRVVFEKLIADHYKA